MKAVIVDGYVDEPAQFGVPPYISTYPRYCAGVLGYLGYDVDYFTIDELRKLDDWDFLREYDLLLLIAGITVPGVYIGGTPIMDKEIERIGNLRDTLKLIAGPVVRGYTIKGGRRAKKLNLTGFDHVIPDDPEVYLYELLSGEKVKDRYSLIDRTIEFSTTILKKHPYYPTVMIELELSRGCDRERFCSFCTEPVFYGRMKVRKVESVLKEVEVLSKSGVKSFRFGRISNILAYSYNQDHSPDHRLIKDLYVGVRKCVPDLKVLHTDNANPWYLVEHRKECEKIIEIISENNTSGDVLSFGVESFDEKVLKLNKREGDPEKILTAVRIVNDIGGIRDENGIPRLLPGVNLLFGLMGEEENTYDLNFTYLKRILDEGLLLRRINIRKVIPFPATEIYRKIKRIKLDEWRFRKFKEKVRKEIDLPMLRRVFPIGTILKNVIVEKVEGKMSFGRQIGSYPILVGIPKIFEKFTRLNTVIVDHGYRSVTGLNHPVNLNEASYDELVAVYGVGGRRAESIILNRPFRSWKELEGLIEDDIIDRLKKIFILEG